MELLPLQWLIVCFGIDTGKSYEEKEGYILFQKATRQSIWMQLLYRPTAQFYWPFTTAEYVFHHGRHLWDAINALLK